MIEVYGDLWTYGDGVDARVITTNGYIKANGRAVMGRGCAREARDRFPALDLWLGGCLLQHGNRCFRTRIADDSGEWDLVTFPVKPEFGRGGVPGWGAPADLDLIRESVYQLVEMANKFEWKRVLMPRPGCGNGGLDWDVVRTMLLGTGMLDDRFEVISYAVDVPSGWVMVGTSHAPVFENGWANVTAE